MNNTQRPYILWLPSWYPNRLEPYHGDFIQRHARAVSLGENVHVIYVVKDDKGVVTNDILTETNTEDRITQTIVYYRVPSLKFSLVNRIISLQKYFNLYRKAIKA